MAVLVRKISRAKWSKGREGEVCADAITNCLKTTDNTLSVWCAETRSDEHINNAIMALVATTRNLDTIDYVIFGDEEVAESGIEIKNTPGATAIKSFVNLHRDLADLHYKELGDVSKIVKREVDEGKVVRINTSKIKEMLGQALESGILKIEDLPEDVQKKLKK